MSEYQGTVDLGPGDTLDIYAITEDEMLAMAAEMRAQQGPPPPPPPAAPSPSGAILSEDGLYRYRLWRVWDATIPHVVWILLNPSTADAAVDDPTLRRCMGFARAWGYGGVVLVNLYALRASDPAALLAHPLPQGTTNWLHIRQACVDPATGLVLCGWGAAAILKRPADRDRANRITQHAAVWRDGEVWCLGTTKEGWPKHPLYLANTSIAVPYR